MSTATNYACPTCAAKPGEPCRTPKGRLARSMHDTRPFDVELPANLKCFFEEIGHQIGSDVKIFETECGNEVEDVTAPKYCPHCQRTVEVSPGCRRCSSTEHTTSYHDAQDAGKDGGAVEIQALSGGDVLRLIISNQREKDS